MAKIIWSPRALNDYLDILHFLQKEWGGKTPQSFALRVEEVLELIVNNPRLFAASQTRKNVRRCVITRQISLFYRENNQKIELIAFIDNRSDPGHINL